MIFFLLFYNEGALVLSRQGCVLQEIVSFLFFLPGSILSCAKEEKHSCQRWMSLNCISRQHLREPRDRRIRLLQIAAMQLVLPSFFFRSRVFMSALLSVAGDNKWCISSRIYFISVPLAHLTLKAFIVEWRR